MRYLASYALAGLAVTSLAMAQSLPLATGHNNNGNVNGGIYFNLTVNTTLTINSIDYVALNGAAANSSFNMFVGPSTWVGNVSANPGPWTLVGATTPVAIPAGVATTVNGVLNPAGPNPGTVTLTPGNYGIALQAVGHSWRYTNGAFTFTNPDLTAVTGGASNAFLTLPTFSPRSINGQINYTLGGTPMPFAQREPYGAGCYRNFRSFYELWPSSVFIDTSNTSMYMVFDSANNRYSTIFGGTTAITPPTSPDLLHGDDTNVVVNLANGQPIVFPNIGGPGVATTTVEMCSNGYVTLSGTNIATQSNPTVAQFLSGQPRIGNWHDFDPPGTGTTPANPPGTTHYDYDALNGAHLFTWLNCPDWGIAASLNTMQIAFFANGDVEFRWGAMSQLGGGGWPTLVGFTPGAGSLDPGTIDLSASFPFGTQGIDQPALGLAGDVNPVLASTVNLTTSNETGLNLGVCFVTLSDLPPFSPVGLDLGIIGAPGCVANVDINQGVGNLISNLGPGFPTMTVPFAIPGGPPSIIGGSFYCQSIWLDPTANAFGMLTSNALRLKVGAF